MARIRFIATLFVFVGIQIGSHAESPYEKRLKDTAKRLPTALDKGDSVFKWWPIDRSPQYTYKVVGTRWDFNKSAKGVTFSLQIRRDASDASLFHFDVTGFDDFPYAGLHVSENRILVLWKLTQDQAAKNEEAREEPLLVFPLAPSLVFYDIPTEYEFLKQTALQSSDESYYGPVHNGMYFVSERSDRDRFQVMQNAHAPLGYTFERGVGLTKWSIPGGYDLELISRKLEPLPEAQSSGK